MQLSNAQPNNEIGWEEGIWALCSNTLLHVKAQNIYLQWRYIFCAFTCNRVLLHRARIPSSHPISLLGWAPLPMSSTHIACCVYLHPDLTPWVADNMVGVTPLTLPISPDPKLHHLSDGE